MKAEFILKHITRHLMLVSNSIDDLGLLNGKIGICIFFYHHYRLTGCSVYKKYAGELVDEVYSEIDLKYPVNFSNGLTGIAWGFEYLIRNQFIMANSDELVEDLDRQIIKCDMRQTKNITLETGLKGFAYYVISRYSYKRRLSPVIPIQYVSELYSSLVNNPYQDMETGRLLHQLEYIMKGEDITMNPDDLLIELINKKNVSLNNIFKKKLSIGLDGGYAGIGLKIINQLNNEKKGIHI